ncbi:carbohydrate kinase [Deinococcus aetherius]|uniref:Carbohydrate kinase n=1 Tax=Deinococcus aetherius TaxID=200252 RepID=A0ABM8ACQ7_9DEIO|nr:carbohydrate kinase [Deinococcus aetherius]
MCGNANVELSLAAPGFSLPPGESTEHPHGLSLGVSGVGFNVAHALARLGAETYFLGFAGTDPAGEVVRRGLEKAGVGAHLVPVPATPLSLVVTTPGGRRHIHRDLKGLGEHPAPTEVFQTTLAGAQVVVLGNVAWTRELLPLARAAGVPVVTDLQGTPGPGHPYDVPYLAADIVFLSGENGEAVQAYRAEHDPRVIVAGLGGEGALLSERGRAPWHQPAVRTRPVMSTNGAGDALLAAFTRAYFGGLGTREALRLACAFASWKCGEAGGAAGHLTRAELSALTETP